jgi:hypothetical protein
VSNFIEHDARLGRLGVLLTAILLAGLLMASVWDGDGNPNTENLPQAIVTVAPRVRTPDEQTVGDDDVSSVGLGRPVRPSQHHRRFLIREFLWRFVAVPCRGPPEGGL